MDNQLKRILLVEDDEDVRSIAEYALIKFGKFEVLPCISASDALKKCVDFQPDLILLDVMMLDMENWLRK